MIDVEIIRFYDSVKDPSWPNIANYHEYQKLPAHIKNECDNLHNFQSRKKELCDPDYWLTQLLEVCVYENLAYVPIPKCACTFYGSMFHNMGWKRVRLIDVDIKNTKFFGLVMHPLERRHKGIAEWLVKSYYENKPQPLESDPWLHSLEEINWPQLHTNIKTKYFKNLLASIISADQHSLPYHLMFGSLLDQINWIPMDTMSRSEAQISLMNFFKLQGHNIQLPMDTEPLHVSTDDQLQVYNIVKEIFNNDPEAIYQFYAIYGNDLKFYYNLVDKFTPDWQHI
jgi:hypothetical protein